MRGLIPSTASSVATKVAYPPDHIRASSTPIFVLPKPVYAFGRLLDIHLANPTILIHESRMASAYAPSATSRPRIAPIASGSILPKSFAASLPFELQTLIFQHIAASLPERLPTLVSRWTPSMERTAFARLPLVCKEWTATARRCLTKQVTISSRPQLKMILTTFRSEAFDGERVEVVNFAMDNTLSSKDALETRDVNALFAIMSRVKKIRVVGFGHRQLYLPTDSLIVMSHLEELDYQPIDRHSIRLPSLDPLMQLPSTKAIILSPKSLTNSSRSPILAPVAQLVRLTLNKVGLDLDRFLPLLASSVKSLRLLEIRDSSLRNLPALSAFLQCDNNIESLFIECHSSILSVGEDVAEYWSLIQVCSKLKVLSLYGTFVQSIAEEWQLPRTLECLSIGADLLTMSQVKEWNELIHGIGEKRMLTHVQVCTPVGAPAPSTLYTCAAFIKDGVNMGYSVDFARAQRFRTLETLETTLALRSDMLEL